MRLIVLFDLPVKRKLDRKAYAQFRKFLLKDGYDMIQFSVYARVCNGMDTVTKHENRLKLNAPGKGSVRYLTMTEKQFVEMKVLVGPKKRQETGTQANQLALF